MSDNRLRKLMLRLAQLLNNGPGAYTFTLIHLDDGTYKLILVGTARVEHLGTAEDCGRLDI